MKEKKPLPKSMGADNQKLIDCDTSEVKQKYFICLHVLYAFKEGRLRQFEKCKAKIDARTCPALIMRVRELKTNEINYVKPKKIEVQPTNPVNKSINIDKSSKSYLRGYTGEK